MKSLKYKIDNQLELNINDLIKEEVSSDIINRAITKFRRSSIKPYFLIKKAINDYCMIRGTTKNEITKVPI